MTPTDALPDASSIATPIQVLVIDDEPQIRRLLDISLRAQGYRTVLADTGDRGLKALATHGADLVVLDLGLPDRDGQDILREIRRWSKVPVIVLTVRAGEAEKVMVLDDGANDYVTKPFSVQELMARIRVLLRSRGIGPDATVAPVVFDDGHLRIDQAKREVFMNGEAVVLGRKEFSLLALLVNSAGRVVTQPQIMRQLWGPVHEEDTHYLRVLTAKLRHKLGDSAVLPRYIATEPGVGLRFIGESTPGTPRC